MSTQHTPEKCGNCGLELDKDGGCYNPYCCDPKEPSKVTTEPWNCGGLDYCPECGATGDYAVLKQKHDELQHWKELALSIYPNTDRLIKARAKAGRNNHGFQ